MQSILDWFQQRGWTPFDFQHAVWEAYLRGQSGLLHAPTGVGKTYAVWMGPVAEFLAERQEGRFQISDFREGAQPRRKMAGARAKLQRTQTEPLRVLWLTPLRALANDTAQSLLEPVRDLGLPWSVELRTGDTSQSLRAKQKERLPTALVTTPESLTLQLSYAEARQRLASLRCVVVDEWHELLGTKRGVQTELALARLRRWLPELRVWGVSATLGNLQQARDVLRGFRAPESERRPADQSERRPARAARDVASPAALGCPSSSEANWPIISSSHAKQIEVRTLLPDDVQRYPWAGHIGTKLVEQVAQTIEAARSCLLFTNTRSQAEIWFQALLTARPDWLGQIALHHGSLERKLRTQVEHLLQAGKLRCVVCTSSLDLGVDFSPVDLVFQVGSPKGIARLLQRAGRSGHQPGATSTIVCVPTHAFELVEFAAARAAIAVRDVEARTPLEKPLDVLAQHIVTIAVGGGFFVDELFDEVRTSYAFSELTAAEWAWCLDFCIRGGATLRAYPQYARIKTDEVGRFGPASQQLARLHRMNIGTITSDMSLNVQQTNGRRLGNIEESFISRLTPGDRFVFAGKVLELVRVREMTAYVRKAKALRGVIPRWNGARFPLSTQLGAAVRCEMGAAAAGEPGSPEIAAAMPLLVMQARDSRLPGADELLIETTRSRDGHHYFVFPFEGRLVHEGLSAVIAQRLTQRVLRTIHLTCNDYGFELLCTTDLALTEQDWRSLLAPDSLTDDLLACLNSTQMSRRQFRDIARIAGLVLQTYPGQPKLGRQLQASSDLFFDVFREFDADNLLLEQAQREVLDQQLEISRLRVALERLQRMRLLLVATERLTPLSFPLWAESLRSQSISSEKWSERVKKMALQLESKVDAAGRDRDGKRASERERAVSASSGRNDERPASAVRPTRRKRVRLAN